MPHHSVVFLGGMEASILLMLIFLRGRVQVAITLLREASKYEPQTCMQESINCDQLIM